jgi:hypothetical protein
VSVAARVTALAVSVAAVVGLGIFVALYYVGGQSALPTVTYTAASVSYYVQDPKTRQWLHTTLFSVPAHTRVNVTIYGYDGCTPLRNNFWSQVLGTTGGTVTVQQFNKGKALGPERTTSVVDSWASCNVAHTFAIPAMGLFVPVASPDASATLCSSSPCTPSSGAYSLEKFSFMSPAHTGIWRWQCLVPCGGGYIDGNGGPMQTVGYMTGEMQVTA